MPVRTLEVLSFLIVAWLICFARPANAAQIESIAVSGTQFQVKMSDGSTLTSRDLVGAVLTLANGAKLRIDGVEVDPDNDAGDVLLHKISIEAADGSWREFCKPDPDGKMLAFPLAGNMRPDGSIVERSGSFQIVCTSGAQGKCVRFGYKPWLDDRNGRAMLDYYNACVRMLRADYCGDGTATTRDGTLINLYDRIGIQADEALPGMQFEAGWSDYGATCIARVRIPENVSLDQLVRSCPRLRDIPLGDECSEAVAEGNPDTLLFDSSFP